ncbi:Protein 4.1 homolog [Eumeta japonica]|uniref:Protein 4.1 homolog n=1 Tax=Eumeta variegata TaxID=151549 RepID=A0A4C1T307_EUMVA|nr:Protein 4.1 homolog [Eumeta japonica]
MVGDEQTGRPGELELVASDTPGSDHGIEAGSTSPGYTKPYEYTDADGDTSPTKIFLVAFVTIKIRMAKTWPRWSRTIVPGSPKRKIGLAFNYAPGSQSPPTKAKLQGSAVDAAIPLSDAQRDLTHHPRVLPKVIALVLQVAISLSWTLPLHF